MLNLTRYPRRRARGKRSSTLIRSDKLPRIQDLLGGTKETVASRMLHGMPWTDSGVSEMLP